MLISLLNAMNVIDLWIFNCLILLFTMKVWPDGSLLRLIEDMFNEVNREL